MHITAIRMRELPLWDTEESSHTAQIYIQCTGYYLSQWDTIWGLQTIFSSPRRYNGAWKRGSTLATGYTE